MCCCCGIAKLSEESEREYWIRWIRDTIKTCEIYNKIVADSHKEIARVMEKYKITEEEI